MKQSSLAAIQNYYGKTAFPSPVIAWQNRLAKAEDFWRDRLSREEGWAKVSAGLLPQAQYEKRRDCDVPRLVHAAERSERLWGLGFNLAALAAGAATFYICVKSGQTRDGFLFLKAMGVGLAAGVATAWFSHPEVDWKIEAARTAKREVAASEAASKRIYALFRNRSSALGLFDETGPFPYPDLPPSLSEKKQKRALKVSKNPAFLKGAASLGVKTEAEASALAALVTSLSAKTPNLGKKRAEAELASVGLRPETPQEKARAGRRLAALVCAFGGA